MQMSDATTLPEHVMRLCRAVMPGVEGVVLATEQGGILGSEARVADAAGIALDAVGARQGSLGVDDTAGASTLVHRKDGLYLVVFVPPGVVAEWRVPAVPGQDAQSIAA